MRSFDVAAAVLLVIGGLNWGLVGAANFDLVATVFGEMSSLSRLVYVVVGLAALYQALQLEGDSTPLVHGRQRASPRDR